MARRERHASVQCDHEGCTERGHYVFDNLTDEREARQRWRKNGWLCSRHTNPDAVLSLDNRERSLVLTAAKSRRYPELKNLFWLEEGHDDVGSGYAYGPGFKLWAKDFPEGTRVTISVRVDPPSEERSF